MAQQFDEPPKEYITINVLKARDLAVGDSNGFSDPYAVVSLGRQKKKTATIKKTLNPEWQESFVFEKTSNLLIVDVWDWDMGSTDDFLGHTEIELEPGIFDGRERFYLLGQRTPDGEETVSGGICLSFLVGGAPSAPKRTNTTNVLDEIKARLVEAQRIGGKSLDLNACELNRVPQAISNAFPELMIFNLSFNKFLSFPEVYMFVTLEELDLTGNKISHMPPAITQLNRLRDLQLNGNSLMIVPDEIGSLTRLEKLSLSNNQISKLSTKIGRLRKLEELSLTGNPLVELPLQLGCCYSLEVLDVSCCNLTAYPGELTYLTKLIELNIATNSIKELPQAMGRMTRLVQLNLSDNKLAELPISLGLCIGLAKLGAGMLIDRNPIQDPEIWRKYKIGTDHLQDYLEKLMMSTIDASSDEVATNGFKLNEYNISQYDELKPIVQPKAVKQAPVQAAPVVDWQLDDKLKALKKWANTTIQFELRPKVTTLQSQLENATDTETVTKLANTIKALRPEMEKARPHVPAYEVPKPALDIHAAKIDIMKNVVRTGLAEMATLLRLVQDNMNKSVVSKEVVGMVQITKGFKAVLDTA